MNDDILVDSYMKSLINIDINKEEFAQYMTPMRQSFLKLP